MSDILKQALPYVLLALLALWSLSLQREVASLEASNATLAASFEEMSKAAEINDKAVVEWVEAHEAMTERLEYLHEELDKADDHHWGDVCLPDEYVRVLHEAGILVHGGGDAAIDPVEGSGNSKASGDHEQGSSGVCARR